MNLQDILFSLQIDESLLQEHSLLLHEVINTLTLLEEKVREPSQPEKAGSDLLQSIFFALTKGGWGTRETTAQHQTMLLKLLELSLEKGALFLPLESQFKLIWERTSSCISRIGLPSKTFELLDKAFPITMMRPSYPWEIAIAKLNTSALAYFLDHGLDPNTQDEKGHTWLHRLALVGTSSELKFSQIERYRAIVHLLQDKADWHALDQQGQTPLHLTLTHKDSGYLLEILNTKPDLVEVQNRAGHTLLLALLASGKHLGAYPIERYTAQEQLVLFLECKAEVNLKDSFGNTPLHYCLTPEACEVLLNYGANPVALNHQGQTPLKMIQNHELWKHSLSDEKKQDLIAQLQPFEDRKDYQHTFPKAKSSMAGKRL